MKNGKYEFIIPPPNYPGKLYRGRYAYEHTVTWWQHSGAVPATGYEIHHLNGNHRDNRIENLKLVSAAEHRKLHGQMRTENASVSAQCFKCKKWFDTTRSKMKTRLKQNLTKRVFCGRSCSVSVQMSEYWAAKNK